MTPDQVLFAMAGGVIGGLVVATVAALVLRRHYSTRRAVARDVRVLERRTR